MLVSLFVYLFASISTKELIKMQQNQMTNQPKQQQQKPIKIY